jgi:hypothetical protein
MAPRSLLVSMPLMVVSSVMVFMVVFFLLLSFGFACRYRVIPCDAITIRSPRANGGGFERTA